MSLIWLSLVACGPRERVVWDRVSTEDNLEDLAVGVALLGKVEGDRDAMRAPHVVGGTLHMEVAGSSVAPRDSSGWWVDSLNPRVVDVTSQLPQDNRLQVELSFLSEGATDLFVYDEHNSIIDVQRLTVYAPTEADLVSWDDLISGRTEPLEGTIHLLQGTPVSLGVRWLDARGTTLSGAGLLKTDGTPNTGVTVSTTISSDRDVLSLDVAPTAAEGSFELDLSANIQRLGSRRFQTHRRAEVTDLTLDQKIVANGPHSLQGTVQSMVLIEGERVPGAAVEWSWVEGTIGTGSLLYLNADLNELHTITACFDSLCAEIEAAGTPARVADGQAPSACGGCQTSSAPLWMAWLPLLLGLRRRP